MRTFINISLIIFCINVTTAHASDMTANEIRAAITNKRVLLATRFGIEFPLFYNANGNVTGDGTGTGLGKYVAPKETGKWWLKGNRLCQQFPTWNKGQIRCFRLKSIGGNNLIWKQDNGSTGRARIG